MRYRAVKDYFPFLVYPVRWSRWLSLRMLFPGVARRIEHAARGRVLAGPFKGLRYPCWHKADLIKLLGEYERSLQPAIEDVIGRRPRRIVNVGAEYGYYALGLALRLPESEMIAYEMDASRRSLVVKYRDLNEVADRVEIRGTCNLATLATDTAVDGVFVVMDVEGAESTLLDPELVPGLRKAEILVELHEIFVPGVTASLHARFEPTHDIQTISSSDARGRDSELAALGGDKIDPRLLLRLLDEGRGTEMSWLHMRPKRTAYNNN